ncbi:uncharacterized protein B0H18DRAFT_954414 [Fomitopsis serialis]|uniref:uncharacterized protein n=1 Tax=Fomitopsis serialis TaxID=139415 RepID=UPI0020088158|nr:uncharacterized protein B0H18DRAFT_954414 [Neoantrodia serialis]KAH9927269.1 hypothetical protein B0H18DRAFT_954414 [Neoantrodia serialis]
MFLVLVSGAWSGTAQPLSLKCIASTVDSNIFNRWMALVRNTQYVPRDIHSITNKEPSNAWPWREYLTGLGRALVAAATRAMRSFPGPWVPQRTHGHGGDVASKLEAWKLPLQARGDDDASGVGRSSGLEDFQSGTGQDCEASIDSRRVGGAEISAEQKRVVSEEMR